MPNDDFLPDKKFGDSMKINSCMLILSLFAVPVLHSNPALAAKLEANVVPRGLPQCGSTYAPPIAQGGDAVKPRKCPLPTQRQYKPKFKTIGHQVLEDESVACFVPDSEFELLDTLIEGGLHQYKTAQGNNVEQSPRLFFQSMGETLLKAGYQLFIPIETLGDALITRQLENGGKHVMDCDTASLLYMSTAEVLGLTVNMVDIRLNSGAGHNYLRWSDAGGEIIDWDTNGRNQCTTPAGLPTWQGRTMSYTEVIGYTRGLRGLLYQKSGRNIEASGDYRAAAAMYPKSPWAYNNLAWLLATRDEFNKPADASQAVDSALTAISIERSVNNLDTLACAYARKGEFASAIAISKEVVSLAPGDETFKQRLQRFQATPPNNCVGLD
jgi:hypothetical protein